MLKAVKEINENIEDDKTKGIILIGEEQYINYVSYFISLTVEDKKPLVIIKNLNDDTKQAALISQDRKSTRLNSSHTDSSRMPSSA